MQTNVEKLQAWIDDQKKNHGLIGIHFDTIYSINGLIDLLDERNPSKKGQFDHLRVAVPEGVEAEIEKLAGEILAMKDAPVLEDKEIF